MTDFPEPLVPEVCSLRFEGEVPPMPVPEGALYGYGASLDWLDEQFTIVRLRLMAVAWAGRPAGSLWNGDTQQLARVAHVSTQRMRKVEARIRAEWVLCRDGRLYHPWLAEQALVAWRRINARRRLDVSSTEWALLRLQVFRRDEFTCQYCDARGVPLQCDHVVPVAAGGINHPSNLITACVDCNRQKRAKSVQDFLADRPERLAAVLSRLQTVGALA